MFNTYVKINFLKMRTHFKILTDFMIFCLITFSSEYTTNIFSKSIFFQLTNKLTSMKCLKLLFFFK